ncbi:MAG: phosphotransferase [Armatimonadota bacterium]|nr:MAG: phosphotransferase [Armatimonadota bacterium]
MSTSETRSQSGPISVFGLSTAQLRPIVEAAAGESVASFAISIEHQVEGYYGFAAEKLIPTFSYVTPEGRRGRVTVFAKHSQNPESPEAEKYRFLAAHGVPLPRVYGVVRSPEDRPILFLEYLDVSEQAQSVRSTEGVLELLSLMARVNAIRPTPEQTAFLHSWRDDPATEVSTLELLWEQAQKGDLGDDLQQFCTSRQDDLPRLLAFTQRLDQQMREMEMGVLHNDFSPENTGRRVTGERVVMDPELMSMGPRFGDVSGWLGRPEDLWTREEDQGDLAEHYLRKYARWGGCPPALDECLEECHLLWVFGLTNLDFGLGLARADSDTCEEYRAGSRRGLLKQLTMLLDRYC